MKTLRFSAFMVCALAMVGYGIAFADLTPQQIQAQFNGAGGPNWSFTASQSFERVFASQIYAQTPDLSAYVASTRTPAGTGFYSFCANSSISSLAASGTAKLNYNLTTGVSENASGKALTVGAAWLYSQYATGRLADFDYVTLPQNAPRNSDASLLNSALSILMKGSAADITAAAPTNKFIRAMLAANPNVNETYWASIYSLNQRYNEIGDYAVFIMNITNASTGNPAQDFFYVAKADLGNGGDQVPEPATLLLWSLGSLGVAGVGYCRKRNKKV